MLITRHFRHLLLLFLLLIVAYLVWSFSIAHKHVANGGKPLADSFRKDEVGNNDTLPDLQLSSHLEIGDEEDILEEADIDTMFDLGNDLVDDDIIPNRGNYREIFSLTTRNRKFFPIYLEGEQAYNPNLIPHPTKHDMWIVVAQHEPSPGEADDVGQQLSCTAGFWEGRLVCTETPIMLPVSHSIRGVCDDSLAYFNYRGGPRDGRVFHGPDAPYIVYGSQSHYTCLGIWIQDIRMLLETYHLEQHTLVKTFRQATELRRPAPWKGIEKNFFLFWDSQGKAYVHYDLWPTRVMAPIDFDGSVGEDIAPPVAEKDQVCMAKYMPSLGPELESIHQATNSLSITLCSRSDPKCTPDDSNTFIMHIFHHKTYFDYHGVYEPYVLLFQRNAPFALHAISQRPLWIYGRNALTKWTSSLQYQGKPDSDIPPGHTEMFYVTSMSWWTHGQRYDGYMDDKMILAFGIEDTRPAGIDVFASDLLQDLAFC